MSGFLKRNTTNRAGGVNPALQPNVSQYGWTNYEAGRVNQLIQYTEISKEVLETMNEKIIYVEKLIDDLESSGGPDGLVLSVNGQKGVVDLHASDIPEEGDGTVQRAINNIRGVTGTVISSPTAPSDPFPNQRWFNTSDGAMYLYYRDADSAQWIEENPASSSEDGLRFELSQLAFDEKVSSSFSNLKRTITTRIDEVLQVGDFTTEEDALRAAILNKAWLSNNKKSAKVTVGANSDFSTIGEAVESLVKIKPTLSEDGFCEINLQAGFTMAEQILVTGGQNLGWIKITSVDSVVPVDHTRIVTALSTEDGLIPIFGARDGSTLPVIGCKFSYPSSTSAKEGVAVIFGSKVQFLPGAGVTKSRNGLKILYGSTALCYIPGLVVGGAGSGAGNTKGVDFSYAANRGLHVAHGSSAFLARSDFSHSGGDYGVYCIWNSRADLYQSDASHAAGTAFNCRDGSVMNCRESCASDSQRGYHALHGSLLNCRSKVTGSETWVKDSAKRCTQYGILASGSSRVEAAEVDVSGCTGSAGCSVGDASSVSFQLGTAMNCSERGVWANGGSSVQADGVDVSNSKIGLIADNGSTIAAQSVSRTSKANDCQTFAILATNGSKITFGQGEAKNANRALESREGSIISARDAVLTGAKSRAVSAIAGSEICVVGADVSGSSDRAITARDGSRVSANGAKITSGGTATIADAEVVAGGFIFLNASTGFTKFTPAEALDNFNKAGTIYQ